MLVSRPVVGRGVIASGTVDAMIIARRGD